MYSIADYDKRYKPLNKSGGDFKNADYVKLPVKPKGDGLQAVLANKRGLEVFGIWCLLLEKTTAQKPEMRGKLLNFKDEPASISELANSISLKGREKLVKYAVSLLVSVGWIISDDDAEISSEEFRKSPSKLTKLKLTKLKHKDFVFLTSEEHKKLISRYGENNTRKLIDALNRYIGQSGRKYKSHYYTLLNFAKRDDMPELKPPKEDTAAEQKALEKKRQNMRQDFGNYYRENTTEILRAMLKDKTHFSNWWLIKEILSERKDK